MDPLNTTGSEKHITHLHYATISQQHHDHNIPPERFYTLKIEILLIKYTVLLLSLILITLDVKNIRNRISAQDDIVAEVILNIMIVY